MPQHNVFASVFKPASLSIIGFLLLLNYQPNTYGNYEGRTSLKTTNAVSLSRSTSSNYTSEQINYFLEVAMGTEYGGSNPTLKKWDEDIKIKVVGSPTPEDLKTLQTVINEINTLTGTVRLQIDPNNANLELYFIPEPRFASYEPNYQPINYGFFWNSWDKDIIYHSRILITTVGVTQKERSHLIREELTQSLGLMKDSDKYRESIFYQDWTDTTSYAAIDKAVIEMLYRPEIRPGMTKAQVLEVFRNIN
ncbi:MAG TPA: DUF2927 domain-containing protein, partial [Coleofasciculaceae cyanobacterium]